MEKKQFNAKYFPYVLGDYVPLIGNGKVLSKYAIKIPEEKWKMYSLKLLNTDLI